MREDKLPWSPEWRAASAWEIATKLWLGRIEAATDVAADFSNCLANERFETLPISVEHGIRAGALAGLHLDPFDRMLIAQAQAEGLAIVSDETLFERYGVPHPVRLSY